MFYWIEILEEYYEDVPIELKSIVKEIFTKDNERYENYQQSFPNPSQKDESFKSSLEKLSISELEKIQQLHLHVNDNLPLNITKCKNLQVLDITHYKKEKKRTFEYFNQGIAEINNLHLINELSNLQILRFNNIDLDKSIASSNFTLTTNLIVISLSNCLISDVHSFIKNQKKLLSLYYNHNQKKLDDIDFINEFSNLILADFGYNNIKELTKFSLKKLRVLDLKSNKIEHLNNNVLESLNSVKVLNFSDNNIEQLPISFFDNLKNLERLDISNNNLKDIHPAIEQLKQLKSLDLGNNQLNILPTEISLLKKLEDLYLTKNNLIELPDGLSKLSRLHTIHFENNSIKNFPYKLLQNQNLVEIMILDNPYVDFPLLDDFKNAIGNSIDDELLFFRHLLSLNPKEDNLNYFTLKIPKLLQTPMLQYIEFFKDYVEATKGKEIIFDVKRDKAGLILITNGNTGVTLPELGEYFQEYVGLVQKDLDKWIPNFDIPKTPIEADIFRSKMERQINNLRSDLEMARIESNYLKEQLTDKSSQIDFLKALSTDLRQDIRLLIEGRTPETLNVEQLLLDIIKEAIRMLERKSSQQLEDLHNDILTDFLRQKGYYATDQTRSGRSKLGVGELDIMIRDKDGVPFSIIEAFRLNSCGKDNKIVAAHIDKLIHDYDTAGHKRNFIIVYAEAKDFSQLWNNYKNYVSELNGKPIFRRKYPLISFKEKEGISQKSSIKIGIAEHYREDSIVEIYHIFINMFGGKV